MDTGRFRLLNPTRARVFHWQQRFRALMGKHQIDDFHPGEALPNGVWELHIQRPLTDRMIATMNNWITSEDPEYRLIPLGIDISADVLCEKDEKAELRTYFDRRLWLRHRNPECEIKYVGGTRYLEREFAARNFVSYSDFKSKSAPLSDCVHLEYRPRGIRTLRADGILNPGDKFPADLLHPKKLHQIFWKAIGLIEFNAQSLGDAILAKQGKPANHRIAREIAEEEIREATTKLKDRQVTACAFILVCRKFGIRPEKVGQPLIHPVFRIKINDQRQLPGHITGGN